MRKYIKRSNDIVIDRSNYKDRDEFSLELGRLITSLLDVGQIIICRYEDCGIYVIESNVDKIDYGYSPQWLSSEEEEALEMWEIDQQAEEELNCENEMIEKDIL